MRIGIRAGAAFVPADFKEHAGELFDPGRGWYHVYTFQAQPPADGRPVGEEVWLDDQCRQERLALVLIDIGAFQFAPLSEAALRHIGQILAFFQQQQMQMILRFAYDTRGQGAEHEPPAIGRVKAHIEQLGRAVEPYLDDILVLQGILVGSWGEMHGSRFLDDASLCGLVDALYRATQGRCFLAVRTPAQWRRIAGSGRIRPKAVKRLGLFNDGIFGSPTDLGTYGSQPGAARTGQWSRAEELDWQARRMGGVPCGGEVLSGQPLKGFRQAEEDLRRMHLCYLNSVYHPQQLEHWKRETVREPGPWQGVTGYDYIGRHLGYRFFVADVRETRAKKLRITIQNSGFAALHEQAGCFLGVSAGQAGIRWQQLDTDPAGWESGRETVLLAPVPKEGRAPGSRLYLQLRRSRDGRVLHFANQGAGESVLLGGFQQAGALV